MRCIVTGGFGFIGSNLVDKLLSEGHEVLVIDKRVPSLDVGVDYFKNEVAKLDLDIAMPMLTNGANGIYRHQEIINWIFKSKVDVIFHLAAQSRVNPSFEFPVGTINTNVIGTLNVLELAKELKSRFVYAGSSSFYGDPRKNPYALSKWFGEETACMYNEIYKIPVAIARFFNVYGPRQPSTGNYATVIGIFEQQKKSKKHLTVTGDGNQRRDFVHVYDIVNGLIAMSQQDWNGEIFNLGSGKNYSINEVAKMFEGKIEYIPARPGEAQETLADISFAQQKLNWNPTIHLEDYVEDFLDENFPIFTDPIVALCNKFKSIWNKK